MMRWVKIEDVGDTEFLIEEQVDRFRFMEENERVIANGGRPATGRPLLLGSRSVALDRTRSSRGVVQETTRVLTEASISGKVDHSAPEGKRHDGRLIPAGTGFEYYRHVHIRRRTNRATAARRPRGSSSSARWSTSWSRKRRSHGRDRDGHGLHGLHGRCSAALPAEAYRKAGDGRKDHRPFLFSAPSARSRCRHNAPRRSGPPAATVLCLRDAPLRRWSGSTSQIDDFVEPEDTRHPRSRRE